MGFLDIAWDGVDTIASAWDDCNIGCPGLDVLNNRLCGGTGLTNFAWEGYTPQSSKYRPCPTSPFDWLAWSDIPSHWPEAARFQIDPSQMPSCPWATAEDGGTITTKCAAKWEKCSDSKCCADAPQFQCFRKDEKYSQCRTECKNASDWECSIVQTETTVGSTSPAAKVPLETANTLRASTSKAPNIPAGMVTTDQATGGSPYLLFPALLAWTLRS